MKDLRAAKDQKRLPQKVLVWNRLRYYIMIVLDLKGLNSYLGWIGNCNISFVGPRLGVDGIDATPKICGCKIICCFIKVVNHLIGNMRSVTFHAPRQLKDTQKNFEPGEKLSGISPLFDTQIPKEYIIS